MNWLLCVVVLCCSAYNANSYAKGSRIITNLRTDELLIGNSGLVARQTRYKRQSPDDDKKRVVCFYASWSFLRQGVNHFTPEDLNPDLCTHIVYGYARPELKEGIIPYDTKPDVEERLWQRTVDLKKINPDLKVILAVGGIFEGSTRFSKIAADPKMRQIFAKSAGSILREYGFDGLDMSWVYPGFSEGSSSSDKQNYILLLQDLRNEFGKDYSISLTVPGLDGLIDAGYDLPEILKYADHVNVWAGAYHAATDPTVHHPSPLYNFPYDETTKADNVDASITSLLKRGVPPSKMNLLIANYGLFYVLEDPTKTDIGAPTEEEAENPEFGGALNYNELCLRIVKENWTVKSINSSALGPYAYKGNHWVAWDDETIIRNKARYALDKKLGGVGFWTVDMDDFKGSCHLVSYPLLKAARQIFLEPQRSPEAKHFGETFKSRSPVIFPESSGKTR